MEKALLLLFLALFGVLFGSFLFCFCAGADKAQSEAESEAQTENQAAQTENQAEEEVTPSRSNSTQEEVTPSRSNSTSTQEEVTLDILDERWNFGELPPEIQQVKDSLQGMSDENILRYIGWSKARTKAVLKGKGKIDEYILSPVPEESPPRYVSLAEILHSELAEIQPQSPDILQELFNLPYLPELFDQ